MVKIIPRAFLEAMVRTRILLNCKLKSNQLNSNHPKLICVSMSNHSLQMHQQLLQYFLICLPTLTMHQSRINRTRQMHYPSTNIRRLHTLLLETKILAPSQICLLLEIYQTLMGHSRPWPKPLSKNLCPM